MGTSVQNWLEHRAAACPERLALRTQAGDLSYRELEREARALAPRLAAVGARRGEAVALALRSPREQAVAMHALMKLGAVAQPLPAGLPEHDLATRLAGLRPAVVLDELPPPVAEGGARSKLLDELALDELCAVLLTSGTEDAPRPVGLTYGNFLWSAAGSAFHLGVRPDDRWLCCLPLNHVAGLSILTRSVIYGTGAVVHERFDPERVGRSLREDAVTLVSLVATQLARLLDDGVDLSGPRAILVGGGPVPPELLEEAAARGARVVQTYGMTETTSQVATLAPEEAHQRPGSAGRPLLGARLRVRDGEVQVRGPVVAPGAAGGDGWLHTGDAGRLDADGYLYVTGRLADTIVTGGENVAPAEVEATLRRHPAVADVAVFGRPDPRWQEAVTAAVVLRPGASATPEELRAHCAAELAAHKVPKTVELTERLPRSATGKLLRRELR